MCMKGIQKDGELVMLIFIQEVKGEQLSLLSEFVPGSQWSGGDRSFACTGIPGSG